jgi:hypothetical protein
MDLLKQYQQLMGNGIGFEHYFLNYYLYLPFSKTQEEITIFESAKYLLDLSLISIKDQNSKNSIDNFFKELTEVLSNMKNYSKCEIDEIKNKLNQTNENKRIFYRNEINSIMVKLQKFIHDKEIEIAKCDLKLVNQDLIDDKNNLSEISKRIIYGDYISKNESVEVFLHQRTMKKVRYKKRDFSEVHQIDLEKLEKIKIKLKEEYSKNFNEGIFQFFYCLFAKDLIISFRFSIYF